MELLEGDRTVAVGAGIGEGFGGFVGCYLRSMMREKPQRFALSAYVLRPWLSCNDGGQSRGGEIQVIR